MQLSGEEVTGTEDCLNLDIYSTKNAEKLPVLVFLHGGNNQTGNTKEIIGSDMVVKNDMVFVSVNYRLGLLGFNCLPALQTEAGSTGNYALLDIAKSLDWVKDNIAEFGGDPENITISGFSAGGRDVMAMLLSLIHILRLLCIGRRVPGCCGGIRAATEGRQADGHDLPKSRFKGQPVPDRPGTDTQIWQKRPVYRPGPLLYAPWDPALLYHQVPGVRIFIFQ